MSLRLHRKYGVNPTICQCFICGNDKNEIALLGANYKEEAPMKMIINFEPCDTCLEKMKIYVVLIESLSSVKPFENMTGQIIWIKHEAFTKLFNCPVPSKGIAFIEPGVVNKLQEITSHIENNQ